MGNSAARWVAVVLASLSFRSALRVGDCSKIVLHSKSRFRNGYANRSANLSTSNSDVTSRTRDYHVTPFPDMEDFLNFAEAAINHIRTVTPGSDEETREDLVGLAEQLLQYLIVVDSTCDSDLFGAVRRLVVAMTEQQERRGRGRPEVAIHKDQLQYLVEQGFRVKDISEMFMCCRRTIERKMKYNITVDRE